MASATPAASPLHRVPAGAKVGVLAVAAVGAFAIDDPRALAALLVLVAAGFLVARIPPRVVAANLRLAASALVVLVLTHAIFGEWRAGIAPSLRLAALMLLSSLVALTTSVTAMVDLVVRVAAPLARVGVDPERLGLMLAMAIRFVPVAGRLAAEVREAQRARGASRDVRAFAVPLLVRALRMADDLGDAIDARGGGSSPPKD